MVCRVQTEWIVKERREGFHKSHQGGWDGYHWLFRWKQMISVWLFACIEWTSQERWDGFHKSHQDGRDGSSWLFGSKQSGQPRRDDRDFMILTRVDGMVPVDYSDGNRVDSQGNLSGLPSTSISRCQLGSICGWGASFLNSFPPLPETTDLQNLRWHSWTSNEQKTRVFCSMLIPSPFYWRVSKKTILFSGFKKSCKKIRETRKLESFH